MKRHTLYRIWCIFLLGTFLACASAQKLAERTFDGLSNEQSSYQSFKETVDSNPVKTANHLSEWDASLRSLNYNLEKFVKKVNKDLNKKKELEGEIESLQPELHKLLSRYVDMEMKVPTWDTQESNNSIQSIYKNLRKIRTHYRKLYGKPARRVNVKVKVKTDNRYYDTYPDCLERVRLATLIDRKRDICMEKARTHCGHQMDLNCVARTIALQAGHAIADGSLCAKIEFVKEKDFHTEKETMREKVTPKGWFQDLASCESQTPILKRRYR